jgi:transcriptional regulator with XRE-family HTH domain
MDILKRIYELRIRRGWSEWKLAQETGLKQSSISDWYSKNQLPKIPSLEKICNAFGITMAEFFCGEGDPVVLTPDQTEILENWSALSPKQKQAVLFLLKNIPTQEDNN